MSDIELVIKIPEEIYNYVQHIGSINMLDTQQIANAIFDGIPLPKGHGKIIDTSELLTVTDIREDGSEFIYIPYSEIENTPTIIEADREVEE